MVSAWFHRFDHGDTIDKWTTLLGAEVDADETFAFQVGVI